MIEILLVQSFFWITRWNLQYRHDKTADKSGWPDSMNEELFVCPLTDWLDCPLSSQGSILSAMADVCFALKLKRYFRLLQTLMYSRLDKNNFQIFWQKTCSHAWNPFEQRFCFIHLFVSQNNKHDGAKKINFNAEYSVQFSVSTILNK